MFDLARQSDVVFTGKVTKLDPSAATIQVDKVLLGKIDAKSVTVTPITLSSDVGRYHSTADDSRTPGISAA